MTLKLLLNLGTGTKKEGKRRKEEKLLPEGCCSSWWQTLHDITADVCTHMHGGVWLGNTSSIWLDYTTEMHMFWRQSASCINTRNIYICWCVYVECCSHKQHGLWQINKRGWVFRNANDTLTCTAWMLSRICGEWICKSKTDHTLGGIW